MCDLYDFKNLYDFKEEQTIYKILYILTLTRQFFIFFVPSKIPPWAVLRRSGEVLVSPGW